MKEAADIIRRAADLVEGDRAVEHGDAVRVFGAAAAYWSVYFGIEIDPDQVATAQELLKIAREGEGAYNPDDYPDKAGYAGISGALRARQEKARATGGTESSGQDRIRRPGLDPGPNAPIDPDLVAKLEAAKDHVMTPDCRSAARKRLAEGES